MLVASGLIGSVLTLFFNGRRERRNWQRDKKHVAYSKVLVALNEWTAAAVNHSILPHEWPDSFTDLYSQTRLLANNMELERALSDFHSITESVKRNAVALKPEQLRDHRSGIIERAYRLENLMKKDLAKH